MPWYQAGRLQLLGTDQGPSLEEPRNQLSGPNEQLIGGRLDRTLREREGREGEGEGSQGSRAAQPEEARATLTTLGAQDTPPHHARPQSPASKGETGLRASEKWKRARSLSMKIRIKNHF